MVIRTSPRRPLNEKKFIVSISFPADLSGEEDGSTPETAVVDPSTTSKDMGFCLVLPGITVIILAVSNRAALSVLYGKNEKTGSVCVYIARHFCRCKRV